MTASEAAVTFFGRTNLGLQEPRAVTDPVISKPDNFKPAMVMAMQGATAPIARVTGWGSRVIKYSTATDGAAQAHYTAPICILSGAATFDAVDAQATGLCNNLPPTFRDSDYSRFYVTSERVSIPKA